MEQFVIADLSKHAAVLRELNIAYMSWILNECEKLLQISAQDAHGMSVEAYVDQVLPKVVHNQPNQEVFYVIFDDQQRAVGMGGLRRVDEQTAEIKRIFVTPEMRGSGLGQRIFTRLVQDATAFNYTRARLDTGPFMTSAHRIYESHGFTDIDPYPGAEVAEALRPFWRFMEKSLG